MGVQFGSFDSICQTAALIICPLVGPDRGIEPGCYSRNVEISGTLIFQPCEYMRLRRSEVVLIVIIATCFVHIVAIIMTAIMIFHIRSKYTAVGESQNISL
jgi:hypothetical protein